MYKTINDITNWVENYPNPKANLEQFALDLADQIRQMSFDLPEGSRLKSILKSASFAIVRWFCDSFQRKEEK